MRFGFAVLSALLLTACGDSEPEPPVKPTLVELDELCSVLADAECSRLAGCSALAAPLDMNACLVLERDVRCGRALVEARRLIAAAEIEFDREAAARCRDAITAIACDSGPRPSALTSPACQQLWAGKSAEGGACSSRYSCSEGHVCVVTNECPGTCKKPAGTNEVCEFSDLCDEAHYCSLTAMRCRERVARDQSCEGALSGNACEDGSFCDLALLGGPRCVPAGGRGFACLSPEQCASGLRCIEGRCSGGLENDGCESSADCKDDRFCRSGRCRTLIAVGQSCVVSEAACALGSDCRGEADSTTCQALGALGGACAEHADCYLGRCQGGRCAALAADQAECETAADCLSGRVCEGLVCRVTDTCFL